MSPSTPHDPQPPTNEARSSTSLEPQTLNDRPEPPAPPLPAAPESTIVKAAPSAAQRFYILRMLAEGGLGKVHVARDEELHREVALKEIQPHLRDNRESLGQFYLEAEVTGQLEHPGVVPIYSFGRHDDGRPYYAMRLIRGERLLDAIEKFHEADKD